MAGFGAQKPTAPITGINVTPLVDITLVLLIIFLVTAKLVISQAVPMDLPKAASGGEVQQVFSVSLRADGSRAVNGAAMSSERELFALAKAAMGAHAELRAVIEADGSVPHRRVLQTLDLLRQAGIERIAFAVQQGLPVEAADEVAP